MLTVGLHVYADVARVERTLASLTRHAPEARVVLLPDGPDPQLARWLRASTRHSQSWSAEPRGAASAFNRLIAFDDAPFIALLEAGVVVTAGAIDRMCAALETVSGAGLAGPTTNSVWNAQRGSGAPDFDAPSAAIEAFASALAERHGDAVEELTPLHSLADFCYVVKREVVERIGGADERYGVGPCWEMDFNIRAARAGHRGLWVRSAYVHRARTTARRDRDERRLFETNKRLYQSKFCGRQLRGEATGFRTHCRGDACSNFAPSELIQLRAEPRPCSPQEPAAARIEPATARIEPAPAPPARAGAAARPFVTCIMPTANRRPWVPLAIASFLRQDYEDAELLIVDDGPSPVADCVPEHPRVRYLRSSGKRTIGTKRNLACAEARGEIIVHWDDDDWYAPSRVRAQVEALAQEGVEACGATRLYYYDPLSDRAFRYEFSGGGAPWLAGNTQAYWKRVWKQSPFPDIQIGEDARFIARLASKAVRAIDDVDLWVGIMHAGNTSTKRVQAPCWRSRPAAEIHALMGDDLARYRDAAAAARHPAPRDAGARPLAEASSEVPLVSCIMPTRDRRSFVRLSLQHFDRQDYPRRELIVVDDGTDPVADLFEGRTDVRYLRLPKRATIGAKRNLACAEARGEIIVHWDDDDWYAPSRLRYQCDPIIAGRADITGLETGRVLRLPEGSFWSIRPEAHRRLFVGDVHGGTLAYRRALLAAGLSYPDIDVAEDAVLLRQAMNRGKRLARLENPGVFVYVRHGGNVWKMSTDREGRPAGWEKAEAPSSFPEEALSEYAKAARPASDRRDSTAIAGPPR